jgi:Protein of unknown function with PCYCGC motif
VKEETMRTRRRRQQSARHGHRHRGSRTGRRAFLYGAGAATIAGLAGWQLWWTAGSNAGAVTTDAIGDKVQTLPKDQLPEFAAGGDLGRLYRYAVEHGDELSYIPCFCGCFRVGHKSNHDCYIKVAHQDGTLTFTSHAAT